MKISTIFALVLRNFSIFAQNQLGDDANRKVIFRMRFSGPDLKLFFNFVRYCPGKSGTTKNF